MAITYLGFRNFFPEFLTGGTVPPEPIIEMFLEVATYYIDPRDSQCRMLNGKSLEYAIYLMAAHLYSLQLQRAEEGSNPGEAQGGFVQSASIGDVSVTKASLPSKDTWEWWLQQTPYGQQLLSLLLAVSVGGTFVGGLPETSAFRKAGGVF